MHRVKATELAAESAARGEQLKFLLMALSQLPPKGTCAALDDWCWGLLQTMARLKREGVRPMALPASVTEEAKPAAWAVIEAFEREVLGALLDRDPDQVESALDARAVAPSVQTGAGDLSATTTPRSGLI